MLKEYIVITETRVEATDISDAVQTAIEVQSPYKAKAYEVHPLKKDSDNGDE